LNSDPAQRKAPVPDAAYISKMQQAYVLARGEREDVLSIVSSNFVPTTDPRMLADAGFRLNLRALFESQGSDSLAPSKLDDARVIGGSSIPSATDVVSVVDNLSGRPGQICSGILINPTHVLTAGHCVCLGANQRVNTGQTVFLNDDHNAYIVRPGEQLFPGKRCPTINTDENADPPEIQIINALKGYDLAILELTRAVSASVAQPDTLLGPQQFAAWKVSQQNNFVRVGGFGFQKLWSPGIYDPLAFGTLNFADLAIPSPSCRSSDAATFGCVPDRELLAATAPNMNVHSTINTKNGPHDTCEGDSGGPAYAQIKTGSAASFYPVGVTSRAATPDGCGAGSIYTLLVAADVRSWLVQKQANFTN
jgi:hypothetical protein